VQWAEWARWRTSFTTKFRAIDLRLLPGADANRVLLTVIFRSLRWRLVAAIPI